MASKTQTLMLILLPLVIFLSHLSSSQASKECPIVTYWGQSADEGELDVACDTGNYDIINIAFINKFGNGKTPILDLAGHGKWSPTKDPLRDCTQYADQVAHCQKKGIKIFVSLGGDASTYDLSSKAEAKDLAKYLWNYYLSGQSSYTSPIGNVVLNGVDFDIEHGDDSFWPVVVEELHSYRKSNNKDFYLSAAPQCPIPDKFLDKAIQTGHFDYIWIQFYNNPPCQYDYKENNHTKKLLDSWSDWTTKYKATKFYVGLPASPKGNGSAGGYVLINDLNEDIIPKVQKDPKFGGIMLWYRLHDLSGYSGQIKCSVLAGFNVVLEPLADMMKSASDVLYRLLSQF